MRIVQNEPKISSPRMKLISQPEQQLPGEHHEILRWPRDLVIVHESVLLRNTVYVTPAGSGRISRLEIRGALLPLSPPMTKIEALGKTRDPGYQQPNYDEKLVRFGWLHCLPANEVRWHFLLSLTSVDSSGWSFQIKETANQWAGWKISLACPKVWACCLCPD